MSDQKCKKVGCYYCAEPGSKYCYFCMCLMCGHKRMHDSSYCGICEPNAIENRHALQNSPEIETDEKGKELEYNPVAWVCHDFKDDKQSEPGSVAFALQNLPEKVKYLIFGKIWRK